MITVLIGMAGAGLSLLLVLAGWVLRGHIGRPRAPEPPPETERERLLAEQRAFRTLMSYSPEIAYGETMTTEEV